MAICPNEFSINIPFFIIKALYSSIIFLFLIIIKVENKPEVLNALDDENIVKVLSSISLLIEPIIVCFLKARSANISSEIINLSYLMQRSPNYLSSSDENTLPVGLAGLLNTTILLEGSFIKISRF